MRFLKYVMVCGLVVLFSGCALTKKVEIEGQEEGLYEAVELFMTKGERQIYSRLPDAESRKEFLKEFWKKRDPALSTEKNEWKQKFMERLEHVNLRFQTEGIPGWKTDRGRIYLYLGPPDRTYQKPFINYPNLKGRIVWVYYRYRLGVEFIDRIGDNTYEMQIDPYYSSRLLDAIEMSKFGLITGDEATIEKASADLNVSYDKKQGRITVGIPAEDLYFTEEKGNLTVDLRFDFYIYAENGVKVGRFSREGHFNGPQEEVLDQKEIPFSFDFDLESGLYFIDVKVSDTEGMGKYRKIEKVKIKPL